MLREALEASLLYDFYGELLPARQKEVMQLYHEENYSLSEIAEEFGISRQAVHDALRNAERSLGAYEDKLGLVRRFENERKTIEKIAGSLTEIMERTEDADVRNAIDRVRSEITGLEF